MSKAKKRLLLATAGALLGAAAVGGVAWWRKAQRAEIIAPALPAESEGSHLHPDARTRIAAARRAAAAGNVGGLAQLSALLHANGLLPEAVRCYELLEQLEPAEPRWLHRHATIAAGFGEIEPAVGRWRKAIALAPDYLPARLRLGDLLLKTERRDEAAAVFREVLQRQPDEPHAQLGLARLDLEAGRWEEARAKLEQVVTRTKYELGYDLIVTVYEQLGRHADAAAVRAQSKASGAYRDFADPWMLALMDDCYDAYQLALAAGAAERAGDAGQALRLMQRAVALAPNEGAMRFQLAAIHTRRGDKALAREQLESCTIVAPEFADGWAHLSALLEESGDRAGAERLVLEGLKRCPDSPGLHLMRARHLRRASQTAPALEAYRRSLELRGNEADPHVERATLLFQTGRTEEAERHLQQALVVEPDHPMALTALTLSAIDRGDEPAARRWLERVRAQPRIPATQAQPLFAAYRERFRREFR